MEPTPARERTCCIAVCTAQRPIMLRACLASLATQHVAPGWKAEIIVIDNEQVPRVAGIVEEFSRNCPLPVTYVHEPRRGIPFARNRAIETSLERNAEWIAFIDDDEVADADWLGAYLKVATETRADVLHGLTKYNYPPLCRKWGLAKKPGRRRDGDRLVCASTNNVMFRTRLAHRSQGGLRFDTRRALTGGSDTAFFYSATDNGARIIHVADAVVTENVPEERCSYKWRMKRYYRCSASSSSIAIQRKGYVRAALRLLPRFAWNLIESLAITLILPFLLIRAEWFRKYLYKAGRRLACALGILAAYIGKLPTPYERIDDH
ncbi:glycosyltransferase [Betaproteobacteria bacterium SCN2]|jgi:succinoglycan biosynthesis protein ExoM|nr:glycosyltransferase [Betaproteobacteria bacterium SCN2]